MHEWFPMMLDEPQPHAVGTGLAYWLFAFLPFCCYPHWSHCPWSVAWD